MFLAAAKTRSDASFFEFLSFAKDAELCQLQYQHVNTFQLSNQHSLLTADYLLTDDEFEVKDFVIKLESMYKSYGFQRRKCRADYLPELLRFVPYIVDNDEYDMFLNNYILFPIITIIDKISMHNPYKELLSFIGNCTATEIDMAQRTKVELWAQSA